MACQFANLQNNGTYAIAMVTRIILCYVVTCHMVHQEFMSCCSHAHEYTELQNTVVATVLFVFRH